MERRFTAAAAMAAVAAVVLMSGCAAAPATSPDLVALPSPTQTPTPTVSPVLEPTIPFDGDCSRVLSAEHLDQLLGEDWVTSEELYSSYGSLPPDVDALGTLGGLECRWFAGDRSSGEHTPIELAVTVLAPESTPPAFVRDYSTTRCEPAYETSECRLTATLGATRVIVKVAYWRDATPDLLQPTLDAVADRVGPSVVAQAVDAQAEWWAIPECAWLGEQMRLEELLGEGYVNGYWEGRPSIEQGMLAEAGVQVSCPWFTDAQKNPDGEFHITDVVLSPGAAWNWEEVKEASGAEIIQVEGAQEAMFLQNGLNVEGRLYATDGVNVVTTHGTQEFAVQMAQRALAALADQ